MLFDVNPQGGDRKLRNHDEPMSRDEFKEYSGLNNKKVKKPSMRHEESALQKSCVSWFKKQYPYLWRSLFMIKNDGEKKKIQNLKTGVWFSPSAMRDQAMGLIPGVSDCEFNLPNKFYPSWYIEFKTSIGGQSQDQIIFEMIAKAAGKKYSIIRKLDEFIYEMQDYMKTVSPELMATIKRFEEAYQETASQKAASRI